MPHKEDDSWYQNDKDKELVELVAKGDISKLKIFIEDPDKDEEIQKNYLRDLRFDSDGVATSIYGKKSGWCLLNAAANNGQSEMVEFLVEEVGMDVDEICYGVPPIFCCFPSMHDVDFKCNKERIDTAKVFIDLGAKVTLSSPYSMGIIHSVCLISDGKLLTDAIRMLVEKAPEACRMKDMEGGNAFHYLALGNLPIYEIHSAVSMLVRAGVENAPNNSGEYADKKPKKFSFESPESLQDIIKSEILKFKGPDPQPVEPQAASVKQGEKQPGK